MSTTPPDALSKMDAHYKALLEQSTARFQEKEDLLNQIEKAFGYVWGGHKDLPDRVRGLLSKYRDMVERLDQAAERLECDKHDHDAVPGAIDALWSRLKSAEAASEHGPLTDIATMTGMSVQVVYQPTSPEEYRFSVHVPGYEGVAGPTPRQALLKMREKVVEGMPKTASPVMAVWVGGDE
jgi:hypothetical protein